MLTYQDFLKVPDNDKDRIAFVRRVIDQHKASELYQTAKIAYEYVKHQNVTIKNYQKLLYRVTGEAIPDNWTANYKMASKFFNRFITQENQYLLGNGVTWQNAATKKKLGKNFDSTMRKLGKSALWGAVSFGFYNYDHLENFDILEYAPLYDEEDGAMKAGVRFWQVDAQKPLRATFYEIDGYTDMIWGQRDNEEGQILHDKRPYILKIKTSVADGEMIYDGMNYPSFPIIPLWGNPEKQSELVGLREQIDCYDLIKSGFANNVDEGSLIYWTLNNAGGMDDVDLAQFVERMKTLHAATTDDNVTAESHNLEAPYQSREALLTRLRSDLYEDAMALDTKNIANGAVTATQIDAAYEPLNSKTDDYEQCIDDFMNELLKIAGIEDEYTFTRSVIVNKSEEVQNVLQSAQYLEGEYVTRKILTILGDGDLADKMIKELDADELNRFAGDSVSGSEGEGEQVATEE